MNTACRSISGTFRDKRLKSDPGVFCDVRQHTLTFALFLITAPGRLNIGCCACPPRAESLEAM